MSGNPLQLFLDRFLLINKERYKNDAKAMTILNGLTLEAINFSNWANGTNATGGKKTTVDMDNTSLKAHSQTYYPLSFTSPLVSTPTDATPVAEADLSKKPKTGLYLYNETSGGALKAAVVLRAPTNLYTEGVAVIKANCLFDLQDADITKVSDTSAKVETKTFTSIINILASSVTEFLYDGTYKYDGSMTY